MQHVTIDLYGVIPSLLSDEALLRSFLEELPEVIGMQKASPVFLEEISTSNPLDDGLSGFVIIATSHVSLHAWPPYNMINIDIFSCEPFHTGTVIDVVTQRFHSQDIETHVIERATRSPRKRSAPLTEDTPLATSYGTQPLGAYAPDAGGPTRQPPRPHLRGRA